MAERKQLFHPDDVKKKIQTSQLINRLTEHALSQEPIMDASQVNAVKILLGKVIPDVKSVELSGPNGGAIEISSKEQRDAAVAAAVRADS